MGIPFLCFSGYTTGVVVGGKGRVLTYTFKILLSIYRTSGWHCHTFEFIQQNLHKIPLQNLWKLLSMMVLAIWEPLCRLFWGPPVAAEFLRKHMTFACLSMTSPCSLNR